MDIPQTQGSKKRVQQPQQPTPKAAPIVQSGFDDIDKPPTPTGVIKKEDTMFKVDGEGKAISEKCPIYLYDRELDREILEEGLFFMQAIKKRKAMDKLIRETNEQDKKGIQELKEKVEKESDKTKRDELKRQLDNKERITANEEIKTRINSIITVDGLQESQEIIKELKEEKKKQKITQFAELIPCTTSEAYLAFEKMKTIDNKETDDWVADLITKKIINPKYDLEEAKKLKPDYKIAMKEAIMEASNYKTKSYRDIMMEKRLEEEKPFTAKKTKPNGENSTPAVSA